MAWKVGDEVQLKSGSPIMTVAEPPTTDAAGAPIVLCAWFDKGEKKVDAFHPDSLKAYVKR